MISPFLKVQGWLTLFGSPLSAGVMLWLFFFRRVSLSDGSDSDSSSASSPLRHEPAPPVLKTSNSQVKKMQFSLVLAVDTVNIKLKSLLIHLFPSPPPMFIWKVTVFFYCSRRHNSFYFSSEYLSHICKS